MSKRILSLCLALAVLFVALPIMPVGNMDANAAAPGEANPVFTPSQIPETVVDKVIANFEEEDARVGETNYNGTRYDATFKANTTAGAATAFTQALVNGAYKVEFTADSSASAYPETHVFIDPALSHNPTAETDMLAFHIDTTGMDSDKIGTETNFRFTLTTSKGTSGVSNKLYVINSKTWYFLPDATEENPNPEKITKTTRSATSVWNCYLDVPNGVSGTVYLPIDAFLLEEGQTLTDYTGNVATWEEYVEANKTGWRHQSSICMNMRDTAGEGDYYIVDDFRWLKESPISYQLQTVTQDFTDFVPNFNWTWCYGNYSVYTNNPSNAVDADEVSNNNGRFTVTPNSTALVGMRITLTIDDLGNWKENYKAFSMDVDFSEVTVNSLYMRPRFYGRKLIDGSSYTTTWAPRGLVYFYNEETGVMSSINTDGGTTTQYNIPIGFKGKIIFLAENMNTVAFTTETGEAYDMHDEFDEFAMCFEVTNWRNAGENQPSIYFDNFTYYADLEGPEAGYNFATDSIGYESNGVIGDAINSVEAWVKTSATAAGTIFADKYTYGSKNYADGYESFHVGMNAAGNPVVYLSCGECAGEFVDWTINSVTINNGKWNHIAVVIDEAAALVRFYLNGVEAATTVLPEGFGLVEMARPIVLGHKINNSVAVSEWFNGEIADVAVWTDARTSGEVMLDALNGVDADAEGLLANWALAGTIDNTLKAYDLKVTPEDEKYAEYVNDITSGSYTIAFLPDTQIVNLRYSDDATEFDYFNNIYTWIIDNAEEYNIKAVLSLGDVTDKNDTTQDADYEWNNASTAFGRLTEAGIPWAVVQGNHDYDSLGGRNSNRFEAAFPVTSAYNVEGQFVFGGSFYLDEYGTLPENQAALSSAYYYLNVDADADYEYMILALEFEAGIGTVEWAEQVVQKNSDKKVIITTHGYMDPNATRIHRTSNGLYHDALNYTGGATGEELWENLVSQYANIEMIVCGHLSCPDIITRVDKGVHGNDVLQVLMDAQGLDASPECPVGMVGLATYNEDGSIVSFKYVATRDYRSDSEVEGKGAYFYDDNSNELTFELGATTAPYVDKSVDNSAKIEADGLYSGGLIVRDFEDCWTSGNGWWATKNLYGNYFEHTGRKRTEVDMSHYSSFIYSWEAGRIMRKPAAEGNTVTFKSLRNFYPIDGETVKAISVHIENASSETQYFRIVLSVPDVMASTFECRNYNNNYVTSHKTYLINDNGNVSVTGNSTWATGIPANFSGTLLIPLDNNFCQWGNIAGNNIYTAEDFASEELNYNVYISFNSQGASCTRGTVYFDNIAYHTSLNDAYVAPVKDKNGNVIDFAEVKDGETLDESTLPAAPEKYGMVFNGWANIDIPGADIYPLYEKIEDNKYTITVPQDATVTYPGTQDYALYNDRVVIEAPATNGEGVPFSHWTANGSVFSYSNKVSFLAFGDAEMVAVYAADAEEGVVVFTNPNAVTSDAADANKFNMHVMGAVYAPEGTQVTEIGILLAAGEYTAAQMIDGTATTVTLKAANAEVNKQFTYNVKNITKGQVRTALTYAKLANGSYVYGDVSCTATVAAAN